MSAWCIDVKDYEKIAAIVLQISALSYLFLRFSEQFVICCSTAPAN